MLVKTLNFSIANVLFCYKYYPEIELDEKSPVLSFLSNNKEYDVKNNIYILPDKSLLYEVIESGNMIYESPVWKKYLCNNKQYYVFSPNNEENVALLEVEDGTFYSLNTYLYRVDFKRQPLPICVTGLILQQKLFYKKQGFLMHGATISLENSGIILTGNSGVGKSTLSKLFRENCVCEQISDDRFVLTKRNEYYYSFGNPLDFKIERNLNKCVKVKKMFFLKHGQVNYVRRLSFKESICKLITISLLPYWDEEQVTNCMQEITHLAHDIECYEFSFLPDSSAVEVLIGENDVS